MANFDLSKIGNSGTKIIGDVAGDNAGFTVAAVGDINGDGQEDYAIGAPINGAGKVYVIYGNPAAGTLDLSNLTQSQGFTISGDAVGDRFGRSVIGIGDFNGDNIGDLAIGAPFGDNGGNGAGEAYVIFGKTGTRANFSVTGLTSANGFTIQGDEAGDEAGLALAAGDVNGDGRPDLIVGAFLDDTVPFLQNEPAGANTGEAYVIFGKAGAQADVDLTNLQGGNSTGFAIRGVGAGNFTGSSVAVGDVNGDNIADIVVAALGANKAYVVLGQTAARGQAVFLSNGSSPGFTIQGKPGGNIDTVAVADLNGDGRAEVIVGDADLAGGAGEVAVVYGVANPAARGTIDLNALGANGFTITGAAGDGIGASLSAVSPNPDGQRDLNGDLFADLLIGGYLASGGSGKTYVVFGQSGTNRASFSLSQPSEYSFATIIGSAGENSGYSVAAQSSDFGETGRILIGAPTGDVGGTDSGTVYFLDAIRIRPNTAPVFTTGTSFTTLRNVPVQIAVKATDADSDDLFFSATTAANGTVSGAAGNYTYTPGTNFIGADSFKVTVDDGFGGTVSQTINLTVNSPTVLNFPPVITSKASYATLLNTALQLTVTATDDQQQLTYTASSTPAHGTVTSNGGGKFTYVPMTGYTGPDSFTVKVFDGDLFATQTINVTTANVPTAASFRLFLADSVYALAGGSGTVLGTNGGQRIALGNAPGFVSLDPSFNRGGDIVELAGTASAWEVNRSGSSAQFFDGDSVVTVPFGTAGTLIAFDDGNRLLKFDAATQSLRLDTQEVTTAFGQVAGAAANPAYPITILPDPGGRLFLADTSKVTLGVISAGTVNVFGTNAANKLEAFQGNIVLDPSFNRGGDRVEFLDPANDFKASRSGSGVKLDGTFVDITIPVGTAGLTLGFSDGDRTLIFDLPNNNILIGSQIISSGGIQLG